MALMIMNREDTKHKLAMLFDDASIESAPIIELPDDRLPISTFVDVGNMMAKQGSKFKPEAFRRVGIDPSDVEAEKKEEDKQSLIGRVFNPRKKEDQTEKVTEKTETE